MILVNRNFGNPVLAEVIGDMFKPTTDDQDIGICLHDNVLATGSSLVANYKNTAATNATTMTSSMCINNVTEIETLNKLVSPKNIFLVTEKFIKTLDKVYTKIWNESFTETGIYNPSALATIYNGFVTDTSLEANSNITIFSRTDIKNSSIELNFMLFKKFVDRCITAGILTEEDRLQYEDQISLINFNRADLSTQINLDNKLITFTASKPIDIKPDLNAMAQQYLEGKKLYLMMTPFLTNESVIKNTRTAKTGTISVIPTDVSLLAAGVAQEPFYNLFGSWTTYDSRGGKSYTVKQPIAFFKPKTNASKFGRSLPLATHLIWSIGTPEDKELALLEGKPVPDLIFDHLDRISHIDSLTLKIKFDKLSF